MVSGRMNATGRNSVLLAKMRITMQNLCTFSKRLYFMAIYSYLPQSQEERVQSSGTSDKSGKTAIIYKQEKVHLDEK